MKISSSDKKDSRLLKQLQKGNKEAFNSIFEKYWNRLYIYAFKIYNDENICEDIIQEVFINLWENNKNYPIENLEAYLFRSVKNRIANHIRDLKFTELHEEVINSIYLFNITSEELGYNDLNSGIIGRIEALPTRHKQIFLLSKFENYTNLEIAELLRISKKRVEVQISNAIKIIRSYLGNKN